MVKYNRYGNHGKRYVLVSDDEEDDPYVHPNYPRHRRCPCQCRCQCRCIDCRRGDCPREMSQDCPTQTPESPIYTPGITGYYSVNSSTMTEEVASKENTLVLPLETLKKPPKTESLMQLLFPKLKESRESETNAEDIPDVNTKRKDRSIFLKGIPVDASIEGLGDLIALAKRVESDFDKDTTYALDLQSLREMLPSLEKLAAMIGLADIKQKVVRQILFYLQGLDDTNKDMLHTVIEGPPGVGKTEIAKILGEIYCGLGILSKETFLSVKRADLIGSYLGQTATKTMKVLERAKGGVLFIDEAYSLGNKEGRDMYSKECIDTITAFLSENREDFVCIIAGYKDALQDCFFKHNAGLARRFPWTYTVTSYDSEELKAIFEKMVLDRKWKTTVDLAFFQEHQATFKCFGGDLENLFHKSKLAHSTRALGLSPDEKKVLSLEDVKDGLALFVKDEEDKTKVYSTMMYS